MGAALGVALAPGMAALVAAEALSGVGLAFFQNGRMGYIGCREHTDGSLEMASSPWRGRDARFSWF